MTNAVTTKKYIGKHTDEDIENRLRIMANYLIDYVLEIQKQANNKRLNVNNESCNLIMEHIIKPIIP